MPTIGSAIQMTCQLDLPIILSIWLMHMTYVITPLLKLTQFFYKGKNMIQDNVIAACACWLSAFSLLFLVRNFVSTPLFSYFCWLIALLLPEFVCRLNIESLRLAMSSLHARVNDWLVIDDWLEIKHRQTSPKNID